MTVAKDYLRADCANCFALCCTALAFERSVDFAFDKPAGEPCRNLLADFGCGIHSRLRDSGMRGSAVYDCFGAGQAVAQGLYGGVSWRDAPETSQEMFAVFPVMRDLHELLWYLTQATGFDPAPELRAALDETERLTRQSPEQILATMPRRTVRQ